ncbi:MAG: transcription repressor NadR [Butyricicoccus sp.]
MHERRERILLLLHGAQGSPVTAASLADQLGVTRQVIVSDIALLRAAGEDIVSTPRGYQMGKAAWVNGLRRTIACRHTTAQMPDELYAIVDNGGSLLDVSIDHPLYGALSGSMHLTCRRDVEDFIARCDTEHAQLLSAISSGQVHLHTIVCPDEAAMEHVLDALRRLGILLDG